MNLFIDFCGAAILFCGFLFLSSIFVFPAGDDGSNFETIVKTAIFSLIGLLISSVLYVGLIPFYDHSKPTPVTFMESTAPEDYGRKSGKNFIYELNRNTTPTDFNFSKEMIPSKLNSDSYHKPVENIWTHD